MRMFKATLDAMKFRKIIESLRSLLEEVIYFSASEKELRLEAMDPSHVCLARLILPTTFFTKYTCDNSKEAPLLLGVNIYIIEKIMKRASAGEILTLELNEQKDNELFLIFSKEKKKSTRKYTYNLIDVEMDVTPKPNFPKNVTITMKEPVFLQNAIKDMEIITEEEVVFETDSTTEDFLIYAKGDNGKITITVPKEEEGIEIEIKKPSLSKYPINYLINILAISQVADSLEISYSQEMPVEFTFKFGSGSCYFFLAPRVDEEIEESVETTPIEEEEEEEEIQKDIEEIEEEEEAETEEE